MTTKISNYLFVFALLLGLASCQKNIENLPGQPPPSNVDSISWLQLSVSGIQLTGTTLQALLSIETKTGEAVYTNKKISVDYVQGAYKTDKIKLSKGDFRISKFIIVTASDTALYATPKSNTQKAPEVTTPLSYPLAITKSGITLTAMQVLKISTADLPAAFGYTNSDFGYQSYLNLKVKLKITVGKVVYDSLPGKIKIEATNAEGSPWTREVDLQKGITDIRVPHDHLNFKFEVIKWNNAVQKVFSRTELQAGSTISLEASGQPKRLKEESIYIENGYGFIPDSRTEYFYDGMNRLLKILNYQKSILVSGLPLTNIYTFAYTGNQLDSINRFDANNSSTGYTAFWYNGDKIQNISNRSYDQETHSVFEYTRTGNYNLIEGDYLFSNGHAMTYKMQFLNENKVSDQAMSSTAGGESGNYEYDDNINPKYQLGYPDLYFSNYSKNNLIKEQKNYGGSFPSVVPYKFEYTYDNDGYPAEVFISYKGGTSGQHLYRMKKFFRYQ